MSTVKQLKQVAIFRGLGVGEIKTILSLTKEIHFRPRQYVFQEGETGTNRETVTKIIADFKREKCVEVRGRNIAIINPEALRAWIH